MSTSRNLAFKLFFLGFLTLFLELVFIRYLSGNIWNLGYFPNLVLIAVFIGMGLGFILHHHISEKISPYIFFTAMTLLGVLVMIVTFAHPALPGFDTSGGEFGGDLYFSATNQATQASVTTFLMFGVWFGLLVLIFFGISQQTAKQFRCFSPLTAYTLDIAGSCAGILTFMLLSWLHCPAYVWFLLLIPLVWMASPFRWFSGLSLGIGLILVLCAGASWHQDSKLLLSPQFKETLHTYWSPYQKIEFTNTKTLSFFQRQIFVNGISHQRMESSDRIIRTWYQIPYQYRKKRKLPPYQNVLIIGAGSGNDVAMALHFQAKSVDAVEIDPIIAYLGKQHHPMAPYRDPRVKVTITDGRAFLTHTQKKFDLIIFALTDSLVKVSPVAQLRLENYLFTEESVKRAFHVLSPTGELMLYNYYRKPWLMQKIVKMLWQATDRRPYLLYQRDDFAVFLVGRTMPPTPVAEMLQSVQTPRDDWPFLYLKERQLPLIYQVFIVALSAFVLLLLLLIQRSRSHLMEATSATVDWLIKLAFLVMGIAFLLLETKSIIQFSLLFGTTWLNNSLVFLAVLLSVLAANWVALFLSRSWLWLIYLLLMLSCMVVLVYPLASLLQIESPVWRFVWASLMTFSPIFFANLIFSIAFRDLKIAEHIFGWNLLGATLGGAVEYLSLLLGYNALAWIVMICYTLTFVFLLLAQNISSSSASSQEQAAD